MFSRSPAALPRLDCSSIPVGSAIPQPEGVPQPPAEWAFSVRRSWPVIFSSDISWGLRRSLLTVGENTTTRSVGSDQHRDA